MSFPSITPADSPWVNPDTNVTYVFKDGKWDAVLPEDGLEFLNVEGGTMRGNLTMGAGTSITGPSDPNGDTGIEVRDDVLLAKGGLQVNELFTMKRADNNQNQLIIEGRVPGTTDDDGNILRLYRNSADTGDAINYTGRIFGDDNLVNKGYVDTKVQELVASGAYLPLVGGTVTGNTTYQRKVYISAEGLSNDDNTRLYLKDISGNVNLTLYPSGLYSGKNEVRVDRSSGQIFTGKKDGTTTFKVYADGSIETTKNTNRSTDKDNVPDKAYIDAAIKYWSMAPARLSWQFSDNTSTSAPADGYFKKDSTGYWRFSFKTYNGIDLGWEKFSDTNKTTTYGPFMSYLVS